jgi:pimeloyl-ACP methyl ester carboxylesterase
MITGTVVLLLAATTLAASPRTTPTEKGSATMSTTPTISRNSGHVEIRGVNYYYEIHGKGEPLLLLHGGLGSIDMFGPNLAILSQHRQVIAVDLQGHGRSTLGNRPIDLPNMGDDMADILERLGDRQVDVLGYSLGGGVALRLAIQHPERVRRMVLVSAVFSTAGFYPEMLPMQAAVGAAMADQIRRRRCTSRTWRSRRSLRTSPGCSTRWARGCARPTTGPTR